MTTLVSGNRANLKKTFTKMLKQVAENDLGEVGISIDIFEGFCFRYCLAKNKDFKVFYEKARGIRHSLSHFTHPRMRTQKLYEQMQELHQLFNRGNEGVSLQNQLRMISEDLVYDISRVSDVKGGFDPATIFDDFDAIIELSDQIKKQGFDVYQLYRQLLRNIGACKPHIPPKTSSTNMPRPQDVKMLRQVVGPVFSVLDDIAGIFDEPIKPPSEKPDKKKDEQYSHLDINELHREAKYAEAMRLIFKENWPPQSAARHLNMTIMELLNLLEVEIDHDAEDEKKEQSDTTSVEIEIEDKDEKKKLQEADDKAKDKSIIDDKG